MLELDRPEPIQHSLLIDWMVDACYGQADGAHVWSSSACLEQRLRHHSLQGLPCSVLWTIETRKKKQQPILTSKESSTELFTDLSTTIIDHRCRIIDLQLRWANQIRQSNAAEQQHDKTKTCIIDEESLSTCTTHTRNQCKVIFLSNQKNRSLPGPTMSSEVISRLWILEMTANQTRDHQGLYKI